MKSFLRDKSRSPQFWLRRTAGATRRGTNSQNEEAEDNLSKRDPLTLGVEKN